MEETVEAPRKEIQAPVKQPEPRRSGRIKKASLETITEAR